MCVCVKFLGGVNQVVSQMLRGISEVFHKVR